MKTFWVPALCAVVVAACGGSAPDDAAQAPMSLSQAHVVATPSGKGRRMHAHRNLIRPRWIQRLTINMSEACPATRALDGCVVDPGRVVALIT
jgi:hypothetical protein